MVQRYDLLGLITMLALGAVALQCVRGMTLPDFGKSTLAFACPSCSFANSVFFSLNFRRELTLSFYGPLKLPNKILDQPRKEFPFRGKKSSHQHPILFLKNLVPAGFCCLTSERINLLLDLGNDVRNAREISLGTL